MKDEKYRNLAVRTKVFALRVINFYSTLSRSTVAQVLGRRLLCSTTSVGAQYREANRGKSTADFISKIEGSLQELDETGYWLELLAESNTGSSVELRWLMTETGELISIFVTVVKSAKKSS